MTFIQRHWLFLTPLLAISAFYGVQNLPGAISLQSEFVILFLHICGVSVLSYAACYFIVPTNWLQQSFPKLVLDRQLNVGALTGLSLYILVLFVAVITADHVPLLAAFQGAGGGDLAEYRETFLRARTGPWQILNYLYVILNNSVMPIVVTYAFWKKRHWRFLAGAIFVVGLSLTLQKGAIASAALPLAALFLMNRQWRSLIVVVIMLFAFIAAMYVIASGRLSSILPTTGSWHESSEAPASVELADPFFNASDVPAEYNLLGGTNQITLAFNRIAWIPYVTAIDWLRYQEVVLNGDMVLGRSIKPVALLLGLPPLHIEREVSSFQWGQNSTGTSSSNAIFIVDAFVNFGWIGVVLYSGLFAFSIKLIVRTGFDPLIASAIVPVYTACFVPLPPVFLSGGLAIFVVLALFLRAPD